MQQSRRMGLKKSHQSAPTGSEVKTAAELSACSYQSALCFPGPASSGHVMKKGSYSM